MKNTIITITGPSCSGKSTLADELINLGIASRIVAHTTRPKRAGEIEGIDYYFKSQEQYNSISPEDFFENIKVNNHRYGILESTIFKTFEQKKPIVIIAALEGLKQINEACYHSNINHCSIFVSTLEKSTLVKRWLRRYKNSSMSPLDDEEFSSRITKTLTSELDLDLEFKYDLRLIDVPLRSAIELTRKKLNK